MLPSLKVNIGADTSQLDRKLSDTQARLRRFARVAAAASLAAAAATAALFTKTAQAVDSQAKLAQSLGTTVSSIQVLERAGALAGVSMSGIEQATKDLTRRLSQAATGTGPAADALNRLNLSANDLMAMPLDERVEAINRAIADFIPAAQQAAVAGQLFGEEGSIAMSRIDSETIRQATADVRDFGVAISEDAANQIEAANDALSRLGLVITGVANRFTAWLAPSVEKAATAIANAITQSDIIVNSLKVLVVVAAGLAASTLPAVVLGLASMIGSISGATTALGIMTGALKVARGAIAAFGGPLGLVYALLGSGAAAWVLFGDEAEKTAPKIDTVEEAQRKLNEALGVYATQAPTSGSEAIAYARNLEKSAEAALAAAEANLAFRESQLSGMRPEAIAGLMNMPGAETNPIVGAIRDAERQREEIEKSQAAIEEARATIRRLSLEAVRSHGPEFNTAADAVSNLNQELTVTIEGIDGLNETFDNLGTGSIQQATTATNTLSNALTEAQKRAKSVADTIQSSMETAFMKMVDGTASFKDAFRAMASDVIKELYRIFVVKKITGIIGGAIEGLLGGGGGAVTTSLRPQMRSFDGGGFTGSGSRSGGVDGRGGFPAIVHPNETVIDHTRGQTMGGGSVVINQTINVSTGVQQTVRTEIKQLMPQIAESAKAAVVDAKLRGGSYGRAFS